MWVMVPPGEATDVQDNHFPRLRALAAQAGKAVLGREQIAELRDELELERLLWADEIGRHRARLAAADAVAGMDRLDAIDAEVQSLFDRVAENLDGKGELDPELLKQVLACPGSGPNGPERPILSGAELQPRLEHIQARLAAKPPAGYWQPPSGVLRGAVAQSSKAWAPDDYFEDPVAAKAWELGYDPVELYRWVYDNIRAEHSFGRLKSVAAVLRSGSGNDADQAGLLAALLRSSGYPSRIAWGVQEIPVAALLEHFGVVDSAALEEGLTNAGIPWTPVVVGGRPVAYRVERFWCEVWIPFANFRGVVLDGSGATWVALDPQLKGRPDLGSRSVLREMGHGSLGFQAAYLRGDYCQGDLNQAGSCPTVRDILMRKIDEYLQGRGETQGYGELAAKAQIEPEILQYLPTSMSGRVVAVNYVGLELPEELEHRLHLVARDGGRVLLDTTVAVADLSATEAALWYLPASTEDEEIVEAFGGYLWDVPPYLVNVALELAAGETQLALGDEGIGMGRPFDLEVTVVVPSGDSVTFTNRELAGVPRGIAIAGGTQGYAVDGEAANTVELFCQLAGDYLDAVARFEDEMGELEALSVVHPFPSLAWVGSAITPLGAMGLVQSLEWQGFFVDADLWGARPAGGHPDVERRWRALTRLEASILERQLFEQHDIASVSADKALILAVAAGIPIAEIDASNLATVLPTLPYGVQILSEIEAWVLSGGGAWVPVNELSYLEWSGVGYVLTDPDSGGAKYQLSGTLSGGMTAVPQGNATIQPFRAVAWPPARHVNKNPLAVSRIDVDPNCKDRVGVAGEDGPCSLRVRALDQRGRSVLDVDVTFKVEIGDGGFPQAGAAALLQQVTVRTNRAGHAQTAFRYGKTTGLVPYYVKLEQADEYATQIGVNAFSATTDPGGLQQVISMYAKPGPLSKVEAVARQWSAVPQAEAGYVQIETKDQHDNPIANVDLTISLAPQDGALVSHEQHRQLCGETARELLISDIPPGQRIINLGEKSRSDGRMSAYVVLGYQEDATYTCQVEGRRGDQTHNDSAEFYAWSVEEDDLFAYWSGRPVNDAGVWVEGYAPGTLVPRAFILDVFVVREEDDGSEVVERVNHEDYDVEFRPSSQCPAGSSTSDAPSDQTPADAWAASLQLGGSAGICGVVGTVKERRDDNWVTVMRGALSQPVWAVTIDWGERDPVILGPDINPDAAVDEALTRNEPELRYTINPTNYTPSSQHIQVRQNDVLIQEGRVKTDLARLSRGQKYLVSPAPVARVILNRDLVNYFGQQEYEIRSADQSLDTVAVRINRAALPAAIDTAHRVENLDVLRLPINRQRGHWQLTMPNNVLLQLRSAGTCQINIASSYWWAKLGWHSIGLWPENNYSANVRATLLSHSVEFGTSANPHQVQGSQWTIRFREGNVDVYDGGDMWFSVEVPVPRASGGFYADRAAEQYHVKVRGTRQTTRAEVEAAINEWVPANVPVAQARERRVLPNALTGIACRENGWSQFCFSWIPGPCRRHDFKIPVSFDGGYAMYQLTTPAPDPHTFQIWDWVRHFVEAASRVHNGFYPGAEAFFNPLPRGVAWGDANVRLELLARYNGGARAAGRYYRYVRNARGVIVNFARRGLRAGYVCDNDSNRAINAATGNEYYSATCYADRTDCP